MKTTLIWASVCGATGIILGALGAHALKDILSESQLQSFETGVKYQMYAALFLLLLALLQVNQVITHTRLARNVTLLGVLFFSGSIYLLNLQGVMGISMRFLGPVTPIGGLLLIAAWVVILIEALRLRS